MNKLHEIEIKNDPYFDWVNKNAIERAKVHFRLAHDSINQKRKFTGLDYWTHTEAVADLVASVVNINTPMGENMVIAALGHDVLEDVAPKNEAFNLDWLVKNFNHEIVSMILQLTDEFTSEKYPKLNRATRKKKEIERLSTIWPEAKTIKLADLIDNSIDIIKNDPGFAITYLKEKENLLPFLKEGNAELWEKANQLLIEGKKLLDIP